jgi:hypothetical protein
MKIRIYDQRDGLDPAQVRGITGWIDAMLDQILDR